MRPLLFAGQAQKEFTVNQAHALTDALLHPAVEGEADDPPGTPAEGESWLVGQVPTGAWTGHARALASFQAGVWVFAVPRDGLRILDRATGQDVLYRSGWQRTVIPGAPVGGMTVDAEARATLDALLAALQTAGVLPTA